jgi:hypothetical protein
MEGSERVIHQRVVVLETRFMDREMFQKIY